MKISNNVMYVNSPSKSTNFKSVKNPCIQKMKHRVVNSSKNDGLKTTFAVLTGLFLGGLTLLGSISTGMLEEGKEKIEELIANKKEQDRINKLPEGLYKEMQQIFFDTYKAAKSSKELNFDELKKIHQNMENELFGGPDYITQQMLFDLYKAVKSSNELH